METKALLFAVSGIAAFFMAYLTGSKSKAILVPAIASGIVLMLPVLSDPKAVDTFGFVGLFVFVCLASIAYAFSATIGTFVGLFANRKRNYEKVRETYRNKDQQ